MKHVYPVIGAGAVVAVGLLISSPVLLAVGGALMVLAMLVSTAIMGWEDDGVAGAVVGALRFVVIGVIGGIAGIAGAAVVGASPQSVSCGGGCKAPAHVGAEAG